MAEKVLTKADIDILEAYASGNDNQSRINYWSYLAVKDYQYGKLALGVVKNNTLYGATANHFLKNSAESSGVTWTIAKGTSLGPHPSPGFF